MRMSRAEIKPTTISRLQNITLGSEEFTLVISIIVLRRSKRAQCFKAQGFELFPWKSDATKRLSRTVFRLVTNKIAAPGFQGGRIAPQNVSFTQEADDVPIEKSIDNHECLRLSAVEGENGFLGDHFG